MALGAIGILCWEIGWPISDAQAEGAELATWGLVVLGIVAEIGLSMGGPKRRRWQRFVGLGALVLLAAARLGLEEPLKRWFGQFFDARAAVLAALAVIQFSLVIPAGFRFLQLAQGKILQKAPPGVLFAGSFLLAIAAGTLLLKTPNATREGIAWVDAAFMSTSAVCVTGLATVDTETGLTFTGQAILLGLVQLGGLGVMTLTFFLAVVAGQGISLRDRARLGDLLSEGNLSEVGRFLRAIVLLTLTLEALGAVGLYLSWREAPPREGGLWWHALFHAVSAFCNAGFSTFSSGFADAALVEDRAAQGIVMVLIVAGGLGFAVLADLPRYAWRTASRLLRRAFPRWRWLQRPPVPAKLHTRLALRVTLALLVGGAVIFLLTERWNFTADRCWEAAFNSVVLRSGGFHLADFGALSFSTVVVCCALMFIGGCPGGTAGGVKTTTFAIAVAELGRILRGHRELHLGNRAISRAVVERSLATLVLSMLWLTVSAVLVSLANAELDPEDIIFECVSAFGTAGLTRGITTQLSDFSKLVIILSMFVGRIGILSFALAIVGTPVARRYSLPEASLPLN